MLKTLLTSALVCMMCHCCSVMRPQEPATAAKLNPMESIVCAVDSDYCLVRNDQTRRNVFTLRHRQSLEPAIGLTFEKYLDTFTFDGKPFVAVAYWNPAFGYLWSAWVRDAEQWMQVLEPQYSDMHFLQPEEGQAQRLECTDVEGRTTAFTLGELLSAHSAR